MADVSEDVPGKTSEVEAVLEGMAQKMYGRSRKGPACVTCGSLKIQREDFKDDLSWREFLISHMCQECQDKTFEYEGQ